MTIKPFDESGREVDSTFSVKRKADVVHVFIESAGGSTKGQSRRNTEYNLGFELLLSRLGQQGAVLTKVEVASRDAQKLPEAQRRIAPSSLRFPIDLTSATSLTTLRKELGRAAGEVGRVLGARPGFWQKRLSFTLSWPAASRHSTAELEALLAGSAWYLPSAGAEVPTSDPSELEARARRVLRILGKKGGPLPPPPPPGAPPIVETTTVDRFLRNPNVVAWIRYQSGGFCEACGLLAPFKTSAGDPFLEVHHVRPLAEGGLDHVDNAIAVCPNCHRRLHHSHDREVFRASTIKRVARLCDHPAKDLSTSVSTS